MQVTPFRKNDEICARSAKQKANLFFAQLDKTFQPFPRQIAKKNA